MSIPKSGAVTGQPITNETNCVSTFQGGGLFSTPLTPYVNPMASIAQALVKAQKAMGNAVKGAKNPFYKSSYADLNSIREACIPVLNDNGIVVLQPTVVVNDRYFVRTTLMHESGVTFTSDTEIVTKPGAGAQEFGSAMSYARRYGLQALLCVGSTDDDAELSMGRGNSTESKANSYSPKATTKASSSFRPASKTTTTAVTAMPAVEATEEEGWQ